MAAKKAKPRGLPKEPISEPPTPERWQFTREFEHASFWGDLETKEAKIEADRLFRFDLIRLKTIRIRVLAL